jgi:small acid-soluble spore protein E (minor gamma-type SASP)
MDKLITVEVIMMTKQNQSNTNAEKVKQQNAASAQGSQFGTEFASETDAQQVRQQNAASAKNQSQSSFATEFGSETDVQSVKKQNQKAETRKAQNSSNNSQNQ